MKDQELSEAILRGMLEMAKGHPDVIVRETAKNAKRDLEALMKLRADTVTWYRKKLKKLIWGEECEKLLETNPSSED